MSRRITSEINPKDVIDIHVHLGGPGGENEQMYRWSRDFRKTISFEGIKLTTKLTDSQITGPRYLSVLFQQLKESKHVDKIVLLGVDNVYRPDGQLAKNEVKLFVSNEYLYHLSQIYPGFLFGCSVHPYAPDALDRLYRCVYNGAVLCKWLPSSMAIDPTHPLCRIFYRALAVLELPLLLHVGPEEAVPSAVGLNEKMLFDAAAGEYGREPGDAISMALDAGVAVIVAHSATPIGPFFDKFHSHWEIVFNKLLNRVGDIDEKIPLYADVSAFCLPGRFKYIEKVLPFAKEMPHRFLYGSDFPIPAVSLRIHQGLEEILDAFGWLAERVLPSNELDKNYQLIGNVFPKAIFYSAHRLLRDPQKSPIGYREFRKKLGLKKKGLLSFLGD